jgi:serralysin
VAWKNAGTNQFTVWDTDSSGNKVGNVIGVVSGTDPSLELIEPSFAQNLNGDGVIGLNLPTTTIESVGSNSLTEVGNEYFLFAHGTLKGPELMFNGAPVTVGEFAGWAPVGAEPIAGGGYEVAWKNAGTNQFTVWDTDSSGDKVGNAIGVVSGTDPSLELIEPSFAQNLNGDGVIGLNLPTTAIESFGAISLTQVGNDYLLFAKGTTKGPELMFNGAPVTVGEFAGWAPVGAEPIGGGGYEVAWKNAGTNQFTVWDTDSSGNKVGNAIGVVSSTDPSLVALEASFQQDFNGNGKIGTLGIST